MSERRALRLLCLALALAGAIGVVLVLTGYIAPTTPDGSAAFPLALAGGIAGLAHLRPRTDERRTR